ncbi:MAG: 4-(cytidine 5'-diphospho)-2-C-methyl-D-erythritol kinase [Clostridiales bacterium]|nr:4-(cytidine 5'-diphospho)-2-C-methyl-D-erythritol kinase [Clostridiales bacterium]
MAIIIRAHAKINWSLDITALRDDGYHELNMLMQRITLADELLFESARWLTLNVDGKIVPTGGRNLVIRAANALNDYMGERKGAKIRLKKQIPVRAGLGGGSADCAATLLALNKLWGYNLPESKLLEIGATLGADVPYLLKGGLMHVYGIGEKMEPVTGAPVLPLVLYRTGDGLSTASVFGEYDRENTRKDAIDIIGVAKALAARDLREYDRLSGNVLEEPAIRMMPEVANAMNKLRSLGAAAVRMSGSGSCVFGVFESDQAAQRAHAAFHGSILAHSME